MLSRAATVHVKVKTGRFLLAFGAALAIAAPAAASAADPGATSATLRTAAAKLITAELNHDGATACGVLNAPLTATVGGLTCTQRWDARSARLLAAPGGAGRLRADLRAVMSAAVTINGEHGAIALPHPLLNGHSRFYWTANCWMLTR
jgi:hypothetical protein